MIDRRLFIAAGLACLAAPAAAHGPTPQKIVETIKISASPDAVWKFAGDFAMIAIWHPKVSSTRVTKGNEPGSERDIELEKGEIKESLDEYDAKTMMIAWRLAKENVEAFPVSFYTASMQLKAADGGTEVEWTARFYRGDTGNFPSDEQNDDAAIKAMTDYFKTGLAGLKTVVEKK